MDSPVDKTLYVVSGFMRTGTSMMMRALEAGGLPAVYRTEREDMRVAYADEHYDPNPGGLYELTRKDYYAHDFPRSFEGQLIKVLGLGVPRMNVMPHGMRVVFMRRDKEEIRQSYLAFFNAEINHALFDEHFEKRMDFALEQIANRKDVQSLDVLWYRDVIKHPIQSFQILKNSGWPIDAAKAAAVVDPELCRYKLEDLTIGVL